MSNKKTILIIEDEALILRALSEGFTRRGYKVLKADDGEVGIAALEKETPDVILLDLILPKVSGQEVLKFMNEKKIIKKIPVVVLTNVSDGSSLKECMELGAKEYIIKANFSFDDMEDTIKRAMGEDKK